MRLTAKARQHAEHETSTTQRSVSFTIARDSLNALSMHMAQVVSVASCLSCQDLS